MGVIISRFRRKETTMQKLERLESKIKSIEEDGHDAELKRKRIIGSIMVYSVGIYVLFAILYYYMYVGRTQHWLHSVLYASPLLVIPILVIFLRSGVSWYYNWTLSKKRMELNRMKTEKKKILEDVMNTEKYKVAKEILDKFGSPEESKPVKSFVPSLNVPGNVPTSPTQATPGQLRQRQLTVLQNSTPTSNALVPVSSTPHNVSDAMYKGRRLVSSNQLPRPLLDRNRTALDKVVEYLFKDGPNNRMALICAECFSHNGMAMIEEFDFVSYNCAYCGHHNPARKQRPVAPLLSPVRALPAPRALTMGGSGDESSVASSASDTEDEDKNKTLLRNDEMEGDSDRPPSAMEEASKFETDKKED